MHCCILFSLELQVSKLYVGIITSQAHIALDFQKRFQCSLNVCIGIALQVSKLAAKPSKCRSGLGVGWIGLDISRQWLVKLKQESLKPRIQKFLQKGMEALLVIGLVKEEATKTCKNEF